MEIEGMIIQDLGLQEGTSKAGNPWKKHEWLLETTGQFPRKVKFTVFGIDRVNTLTFEQGRSYVIQVDVESREYNGRWYTDILAYAARPIEQGMQVQGPSGGQTGGFTAPTNPYGQPQFAQQPQSQNPFGQSTPDFSQSDSSEDLPF